VKKKTKLDDDYKDSNKKIEQQVQEDIKHIESETEALIEEANRVDESVESSLKVPEKNKQEKG
jgi:hypothetical protein